VRKFVSLAVITAATAIAVQAAVAVKDIDGRSWTLFASPIDVLFVISADCPVSNAYAPEIQSICSNYRAKGVRCFTVYADPEDTITSVARHRKDFGYGVTIPAILDHDHTFVKTIGATITPEAAVYAGAGRVYRGRIDDRYVDVGRARRFATRHDVDIAIDAALAGKAISPAEMPAVGCSLLP
jgi:hypothetical protein